MLGGQLRGRLLRDVLCHGDAHTANVLIDPDGQVWLIDWDDAVLAPQERDLMFVVHGVLADAPVSDREQSWFFEGYGPAELDPVRLGYYRCSGALQDLGGFAAVVLDDRQHSSEERAHALTNFRSLLWPSGIVELA